MEERYLIQSGTGDVFHWNEHLAKRADMVLYDEEVLGPMVNGKSTFLLEQAEAEKKRAAEAAKKTKKEKKDEE